MALPRVRIKLHSCSNRQPNWKTILLLRQGCSRTSLLLDYICDFLHSCFFLCCPPSLCSHADSSIFICCHHVVQSSYLFFIPVLRRAGHSSQCLLLLCMSVLWCCLGRWSVCSASLQQSTPRWRSSRHRRHRTPRRPRCALRCPQLPTRSPRCRLCSLPSIGEQVENALRSLKGTGIIRTDH